MRGFVYTLLVVLSIMLSCSAISTINELPNSKPLISQFIDSDGGTLEYTKPDEFFEDVSIEVYNNTVTQETEFKIAYFESFPKKPNNMNPESIAFEFKFDAILNKRVKISIPYIATDATLTPIALFEFSKAEKRWHFAGCVSIDTTAKTVSALIDSPGIYAIMSFSDEMPSFASTDFEIGWDTLQVNDEFTKQFYNAAASYAFWYYNNKREVSANLQTKYEKDTSLLVAKSADWEFYRSQFTSISEIIDKTKLSGKSAANIIKTAIAFENRPIVAILSDQNNKYTIIINKYQNNKFSYYDPFDNQKEKEFLFDSSSDEMFYIEDDGITIGSKIDNVGFLGTLSSCDKGFEKIYDYFEKQTTNVLDQVVGPLGNPKIGGTNLKIDSGNLNDFEFFITDNAVTNDIHIRVGEIQSIPTPPKGATWSLPLFRLTGPIDSMFNVPVKITVPDGFLDGVNIPLDRIRIAAYNFETNCWANTKLTFGVFNNDITIESQYASDYAMFYFEPLADIPTVPTYATTVFDEWPSKLTNASQLVDDCAFYNMNTLNIAAFECTGFIEYTVRFKREGNMVDKNEFNVNNRWYSFNSLINKANALDVDVNLIISCFDSSKSFGIDNVENPDTRAAYIVNTIIPYTLTHFKGINGIILKNVRFEKSNHSEYELDLISKFIRKVRETIGKKEANNPKLIFEIESSMARDLGNEFGQRLSEFSKYADALLLNTFEETTQQPYDKILTSDYIECAKIVCSESNELSLVANILTKVNADTTTIENQLDCALKLYSDGFSIDDFNSTDDFYEWPKIGMFVPSN